MNRSRLYWAVLIFLVGFCALVAGVAFYYLRPAMDAAFHATTKEKHALRAYSALLLAILLVILIGGIMLTFRIGRFFFPRPPTPRTRTKYVDAWAESAKRMPIPPGEDEA